MRKLWLKIIKNNFKRENLRLKHDFNLQHKYENDSSEDKVLLKIVSKINIVPGMEVYFCNLSQHRQKDHESEARLEHVAN